MGDFWEEIVFLKGVVKFREIMNLKFKISRRTPDSAPDNLECSCVGVNCLVVFQK